MPPRAGDYGEATSEPISGLPDGAVGFTFTSTSSNPVEVGSIAFAETDDGRIVGVGVTHSGEGEASVDVADLRSSEPPTWTPPAEHTPGHDQRRWYDG
jgi:hypothetical protein